MAKVIDLTEKLGFAENPVIKIRDVEIEVNKSASNMLQIMQLISNGEEVGPAELFDAIKLIFGDDGAKKLDTLNLDVNDLMIVLTEAVNMVTGEDDEDESKNAMTPVTA